MLLLLSIVLETVFLVLAYLILRPLEVMWSTRRERELQVLRALSRDRPLPRVRRITWTEFTLRLTVVFLLLFILPYLLFFMLHLY